MTPRASGSLPLATSLHRPRFSDRARRGAGFVSQLLTVCALALAAPAALAFDADGDAFDGAWTERSTHGEAPWTARPALHVVPTRDGLEAHALPMPRVLPIVPARHDDRGDRDDWRERRHHRHHRHHRHDRHDHRAWHWDDHQWHWGFEREVRPYGWCPPRSRAPLYRWRLEGRW
jgi:hypothetical protein